MNYSLNSQSLILCWTLNRQVRLEPGKGSVRVGIRPSGGSPECLGLVQTISFTNQGSGGGVLGREPGGSDSGPGGTVGKASIRLMSGDMGALNSGGGHWWQWQRRQQHDQHGHQLPSSQSDTGPGQRECDHGSSHLRSRPRTLPRGVLNRHQSD